MQSEKQIAAAQGVLGRGGVYVGAELVKAALEAALSAAEPVAYRVRMNGQVWQLRHVIHQFDKWDIIEPLYAAPPAPSVAVKALVWKAHNEGFGHGRMYYGTGAFGHWYGVSRVKTGCWGCVHHIDGNAVHLPVAESLEVAKAAAQADYEARIRSALSAQVQDVAGWERITIETGRKSGTTHADVWPYGEGWEIDTDRGRVNTPDAGWDRFSHHEELYFRRRTNVLPAAPAKQEG